MASWNQLCIEIKQRIIVEVCNIPEDEFYAPESNYSLSKGQRRALLRLSGVNRDLWNLAGEYLWHVSKDASWRAARLACTLTGSACAQTFACPCRPGLLSKLAQKSGLRGRIKYIRVVKLTAGNYLYGANATKDLQWVNRCVHEFANVIGRCRSVQRFEVELDTQSVLVVSALPKAFFATVDSLTIDSNCGLAQAMDAAGILEKCSTSLNKLALAGIRLNSLLPVSKKGCHAQTRRFHAALSNLTHLEHLTLTASSLPPLRKDQGPSLDKVGTAHLCFTALRSLDLSAFQSHAAAALAFAQAPLRDFSLELWSDPGWGTITPGVEHRQVILRLLEQHQGHLRRIRIADAQLPPGEAWKEVEKACASVDVELCVTGRVDMHQDAGE